MDKFRRIVVAMDSMKGCLESMEASSALAEGLKARFPEAAVQVIPVSDGGEGMVDMVVGCLDGAAYQSCEVHGPLGERVQARWLWHETCERKVAYMDFASASGLGLVKEEEVRNPLLASSRGVGEMIEDAISKGTEEIYLGLGGSATVDAALGALQALGIRFYDKDGLELRLPLTGGMLEKVADYEIPEDVRSRLASVQITLLCDVDAPLTGEGGAARVFAPQKGADSAMVDELEKGMDNLRILIKRKTGVDLNSHPGTGAAGGAAGGLMAIAGAEIRKGASVLLDVIGFDEIIAGADLIVTGEGASDRQTLMGKIPYEILRRGASRGIPVWLVAGRIEDMDSLRLAGFQRLICINDTHILTRTHTNGCCPMNPEVALSRLRGCFYIL